MMPLSSNVFRAGINRVVAARNIFGDGGFTHDDAVTREELLRDIGAPLRDADRLRLMRGDERPSAVSARGRRWICVSEAGGDIRASPVGLGRLRGDARDLAFWIARAKRASRSGKNVSLVILPAQTSCQESFRGTSPG